MNQINKTILCGLLLCLFGAGGKGYGQEVKPGTVLWSIYTGGTTDGRGYSCSPAIAEDGTIYIGSAHGVGNQLNAVNGKTGTRKWQFSIGGGVHTFPVIGTDGTVYAGTYDKLFALHPSGRKKWVFEDDDEWSYFTAPAIGGDGTIYVGAFDQLGNNFYALDGETGEIKWESSIKRGPEGTPVVGVNGLVYVGAGEKGSNDFLFALDGQNGSEKWKVKTGWMMYSSIAIGENNTLHYGPENGDLSVYAINGNSGEEKWKINNLSEIGNNASPSIGDDGTIYFTSISKKIIN